jgi:hypothetical protein
VSLLAVVAALLVPWVAGALVLRAIFFERTAGSWSFCIGYGYVFGALLTSGLLAAESSFGVGFSVTVSMVVFLALILAAFVIDTRRTRVASTESATSSDEVVPQWAVIATGCILVWLLLRFGSIAYELTDRGLYGFDAFSTWIYRARVWVESGSMTPFVFPDVWLADRQSGVGALPAAHYPEAVSLIAVWPALALGQWNEAVALLPWLLLFVALGFALYGQARAWGASRFESVIVVWLLLSMPLVAGQTALAGYADLWLAATLGFGFMAFLQWMRTGDSRHGLLAAVFVVAGVFIKAEGLVWSLFFLPALLARWVGARGWLLMAGVAVGAAALLGVSGGIATDLPLIGRLELSLDRVYTPLTGTFEFIAQDDVLRPLLIHLFVFDTWHLFAVAMLAGLVVSLARATDSRRHLESWESAALAWVLSAFIGFYVLFFWTPAAEWVRLGTSANRILLHFAPALMFWLLCLWLSRRKPSAQGKSSAEEQ